MTIDRWLSVARRIDHGIRDHETQQHQYHWLWQHPLLLDALIALLEAVLRDDHPDDYRLTFEVLCEFYCPSLDMRDALPIR